VIVEIISEEVNEVDGVVARVLVGVAGKEDKGDVADAVSHPRVGTVESSGWIPTEKHLMSTV
jgi:hypothetical protein